MWAKKYSVIYICIWATYQPLVPMSVQLFACRLFHALFFLFLFLGMCFCVDIFQAPGK